MKKPHQSSSHRCVGACIMSWGYFSGIVFVYVFKQLLKHAAWWWEKTFMQYYTECLPCFYLLFTTVTLTKHCDAIYSLDDNSSIVSFLWMFLFHHHKCQKTAPIMFANLPLLHGLVISMAHLPDLLQIWSVTLGSHAIFKMQNWQDTFDLPPAPESGP